MLAKDLQEPITLNFPNKRHGGHKQGKQYQHFQMTHAQTEASTLD